MNTENKVNIETFSASTLDLIIQDNAGEVIALTDDSDTTVVQQMEMIPYNTSNNNSQLTCL